MDADSDGEAQAAPTTSGYTKIFKPEPKKKTKKKKKVMKAQAGKKRKKVMKADAAKKTTSPRNKRSRDSDEVKEAKTKFAAAAHRVYSKHFHGEEKIGYSHGLDKVATQDAAGRAARKAVVEYKDKNDYKIFMTF